MTGCRPQSPRRGLARAVAAGALALVAGVGVAGPVSPVGAVPSEASERAAGCVTAEGEAAVGQVLVVVAFPSRIVTGCATPGPTTSGIDVLRAAGFAPVLSSYDSVGGRVAVCALTDPSTGEQVGCATGPSCLTCAAPDSWVYYRCWRYSPVGAGSTVPPGGTIEAWHFGRTMTWPGAGPAACDRDGDDTVPTPPPPPPTPPGGGSGGGGAPGGGGGNPSGEPVAPGPGGQPGSPSGSEPGGAGAPSDSTAPGTPGAGPDPASSSTTPGSSPTTASDGTAPGDKAGETEKDGGPDADRIAASGPIPGSGPAGDGGGGGGGAVVPLALTGGLVAALGALALRLRHRRSSGART